MNNENYVNHYIDILTATLTDAIVRNVSLQAKDKINEEVISNLQSQLNTVQSEYDSVKNKMQHLNTFQNEIVKEREAHKKTRESYDELIKELNDKIEYLQLTPAKRKKIDEVSQTEFDDAISIKTTEDGGSF